MRKILCLVFLFASGALHAQEEPVLDIVFTDPINEADVLLYDEITSLKQLQNTYRTLFPFSNEDFYTCYDSLETPELNWVQDSLVRVDVNYKAKSAKGYAFFKPATSDVNTAIFIIPGSGHNQSGAIYRNASNYHNIPEPVSEVYRDQGDVYVFIKPNEDILAIHRNRLKAYTANIYPQLQVSNTPYAANYLVHCLAFIKALKTKYDRVIVAGLSQGGFAALSVSLLTEPTACVVASGYSVLFEEAYFANPNQPIMGDFYDHFEKEKIRNMIDQGSTYYLFSWGADEGDYYSLENKDLLSYNYFKGTNKVSYYNQHSGHYFPPYEIVSGFMHLNNIRPLVSFKRVSDCEKSEEIVIVEGKGDLPIQFQVQFENEIQEPYSLSQRIDTLRNLSDGKYTFSSPQNAAFTSVFRKDVTIKNPKALSEATLQTSDFTYERLNNSWVYNGVVDTVLLTRMTFTDAASNSFDFDPDSEIRLRSGIYNKLVVSTRGNCTIEKDINIALEKPYFSVYPNPCTDHFLFEVNFYFPADLSIVLCDPLGGQIATYEVSLNSYNIDLSGYAPGIYFLRVFDRKNEVEFKSFKIVKNSL
jgi:hypothetical protein